MSRNQRIGLLVAAVAVLVVVFVIAKSGGSDDNSTSSTTGGSAAVQTVEVKNAKPVGGIKVLKFNKGGTIRFKVHSDVADEIHFHGYDKHQDVKKGGTVTFDVPATIDGKFVVELEGRKQQIASVEVAP